MLPVKERPTKKMSTWGGSTLSEFGRLQRMMDRMFNELVGSIFSSTMPTVGMGFYRLGKVEPTTWEPPVNMYTYNNNLVVEFFLPGVEKSNIDLRVSEDSLTIKGELPMPCGGDCSGCEWYSYEFPYGNFERTISLPYMVNPSSTTAQYKNGILTVTMPISSGHGGHKINIS